MAQDVLHTTTAHQGATTMYGQTVVTEACWKNGDGQCDGTSADGDYCECPCHERSLPHTTVGVERWHRLGFALGVLGDYYLSVKVINNDGTVRRLAL